MKITQITLKNIGKTEQFQTSLGDGCNILPKNNDVFNALCYFAQSWANRIYAQGFVRSFSESSTLEMELVDGERKFFVTYFMRGGQIVVTVCLNGTQLPSDSVEFTDALTEYLYPHEIAQFSFFDGTTRVDYAAKCQEKYLQATLDDIREELTRQGWLPTERDLMGFASSEWHGGKSSYAMYRFVRQYLHTAQPVVLTTESGNIFFDGANFTANGEALDLNEPMGRTLLSQEDERLARFCFSNRMFRAECGAQGMRHNFPVVVRGLSLRQASMVQSNIRDVQIVVFLQSDTNE